MFIVVKVLQGTDLINILGVHILFVRLTKKSNVFNNEYIFYMNAEYRDY